MKDRPDLNALAAQHSAEFRLGSFEIHVGYVQNLCNSKGDPVYGLMQAAEDSGKAYIGIQDPDTWIEDGGMECTAENIERILIHELIHVRLMNVVAGQAARAEVVAEEQAVHALADAFARASQKVREAIGEGLAKAFADVSGNRRDRAVGKFMARAFSRVLAPAFGAGQEKQMNPDMLKALGLALFGLMVLVDQGEGDVKTKAQQMLADLQGIAGDQTEAALGLARAAIVGGDGAAGDAGAESQRMAAAGCEQQKMMSEEDMAKAFGSGPRTLVAAITLAKKHFSGVENDETAKRTEILEKNKTRIPEACLPFAKACSIQDLEAFVASLPEKPLPQPRKNEGKGFSVGKPLLAGAKDPKEDKDVQSVLDSLGKRPADVERLARQFGVKNPSKVLEGLGKMTKVEIAAGGTTSE